MRHPQPIWLYGLILTVAAWQGAAGAPPGAREKNASEKTTATTAPDTAAITHHTINVGGKPLEYTATAGFLPLLDEAGKLEANIFYVAYVKGGGRAETGRPVMFAFNGGPGAAAVWLNMGGLGPKRVVMDGNGTTLPRTFQMTDNDSTWLELSDLVFVDPVGTGYSRAAPGVDPRRYYEVNEDIRAAARFIRLYVTQHERWLSPLYLAGESYGTTRVAGVAQRLQHDYGLYPRGVILISTVLDFQTIMPGGGNDLAYALGLPSCTAAAWYQHKLAPPLQADLKQTLAEVEAWALGDYLTALAQGDALPKAEQARIAGKLAAYTGLPRREIENNRLRISTMKYSRELLRDEGSVLGLMDGRVKGAATARSSEYEPYDPSFFLAIGPFVATFNDYVRRELKFESSLNYEFLSSEAHNAWKWSADGHFLDVSENLNKAMTANSRLKLFNAAGIFDLTTPYLAQQYSLNHLGLEESVRGRITFTKYPSGHQIYTSLAALRELKEDVAAFMAQP